MIECVRGVTRVADCALPHGLSVSVADTVDHARVPLANDNRNTKHFVCFSLRQDVVGPLVFFSRGGDLFAKMGSSLPPFPLFHPLSHTGVAFAKSS